MIFWDVVGALLLVLGSLFALASAIGVLRFPDTLARAHALGVAATLGVLLVMLGVIASLRDLGAGAKAVLTVVFIFLTAPVGSHMLGRTAYRFGRMPMMLRLDELRSHEEEVAEDASA